MKLLVAVLLTLVTANVAMAQQGRATNTEPLSFGFDQIIVDLNKVEWGPLEIDGFAPGAEISVLRGTLEGGPVEVTIRVPANYTIPNHSHTSAETYYWIRGDFTYVAGDGSAVDLSGQTLISLPGSSPHAIICKDEPCQFYVRYSSSFDIQIHSMPELKRISLE